MALLWYDGFNSASSADILLGYDGGSAVTTTVTSPRTGGGAARFIATTQYLAKTISPSGATVVVGFAIRLADNPPGAANQILRLREGTTVHLAVELQTDRTLKLVHGSGTVLGTTSALPNDTVTWSYVELKAVVDDSTGSFDLRLNDVSQFSGSATDTRNGGTGVVNNIQLGSPTVSSADWEADDFYICDGSGSELNDFLTSAVRIDTLTVTAAGDLAQWTPSTGSNYQNVDETGASNGDTDYNSAASAGLIDALGCTDLPVTPAAIKAVRGVVIARKDDAGLNTIKVGVRSNGVASTESSQALTTSYAAYYGGIQTTNPDGGVAWTKSAVDAAQVQYERTA